jgi:two-component system sensor histidine kinase/response regulator
MYLNNKRIFVLEDNLENKAIAQMLLERAGATVLVDRWGVETLSNLQRFAPVDAILLDLMLPGLISGYDIFQQIRSQPEFNHVPIVAVSAADSSTALPKARSMGFSGFISKPIDFRLFAQQIKHVIDGDLIWHTT